MPEPAIPADPAAWLDWPRALAVVDGDVPLLEHLVDVFIRQYAQVPEELRAAVRGGDWSVARRRSHQLAGSAGAIGALGLEKLARSADAAAHRMLEGPVTADAREQSLVEVGAVIRRLEWTLERAGAWRSGDEHPG